MNNYRSLRLFFPLSLLLFLISMQHVAAKHDMLLKGGHMIDPKNLIDGPMDVAITDGKISLVATNINPKQASKVVDISGLYVTPGLIDMHVHVFMGNDPGSYIADGATSVMPDGFTFRSGVTWKNQKI